MFTSQGGEEYEGVKDLTITSEGYIEKTDITSEAPNTAGNKIVVDDKGKATNEVVYRVDINPNAYTLVGGGKTLTLADRIDTNMELDTDSVRIYMDVPGNEPVEIHDSEAISISYNDDSRIMTIGGLPDETHLRVEYTCFARSTGVDTFTNTATIYGGGSHSSYTEKEHRVETSSASMEGGELDLTLQKIDHDKITKRLPGAKFKLYKMTFNGVTEDDFAALLNEIETNPEMTGYTNDKFLLSNATETYMGEYTTSDPEGQIIWTGDSSHGGLQERTLFYWEETKAPDGYSDSEIGVKHYFVIYQVEPTDGQTDFVLEAHQKMAWALDDTISNTNPGITVASVTGGMVWSATNTKYASITATKEWDDEDDFYETRPTSNGIKLNLYQIAPDGSKTLMSDVSPVVIRPNEKGEWPSYTWTKLPFTDPVSGQDYKYTVEEEPVKDYTTSYSDGGEGQTGGIITVTNKMIPKKTTISVRKQFEPADIKKPDRIVVDLMEIRTYLDGTKTEPARVKSEVLSASNNWAYSWEDLPTTGKERDGRYYAITYTVSERTVVNFNFVVTYSDGQQGVLEALSTDPLVITNSLNGSLEITKTITGLKQGDELTAEQKAAIVFTVTGPNNYSTTFTYADMTNGVKTLDNLVPGDYVVMESVPNDSVPEGYSYLKANFKVNDEVTTNGAVTVVGDETAEVEIENEYEAQTGSLKITKSIATGSNQDTTQVFTFQVTLKNADGSPYVGTVKRTSEGGSEETVTLGASDNGVVTVTTTGAGMATIAEIPAGTKYEVTESSPTTGWKVTYTNAEGTITAGQESQVGVTNAHGSIEVTKELKAGTADYANTAAEDFIVALYELDGSTETYKDRKTITITNGSSGTAKFSDLEIGKTYKVYEVTVDGDNVTKVSGKYGKYTVSYDNNEVTLTSENPDVTNTKVINTISAEYTPLVEKKLNGLDFTGKLNGATDADPVTNFTFYLRSTDAQGEVVSGGSVQTKSTGDNGTVSFDAITYSTAGTYYYRISEEMTDTSSMDYAAPVYLKVVVDNAFNVIATYYSDATFTTVCTDSAKAVFNNRQIKSESATKSWSDNVTAGSIQYVIYSLSRSIGETPDTAFNTAHSAEKVEAANWGKTWNDLDAYGAIGAVKGEFTYTVEEVGFKYAGVEYTVSKTDNVYSVKVKDTNANADWFVQKGANNAFTNLLNKTKIDVEKEWYNESGIKVDDPITDGLVDTDQTVQFVLYQVGPDQGVGQNNTIDYGKTYDASDTTAITDGNARNVYTISYDSSRRTWKWSKEDLPRYYYDSTEGKYKEYKYYIVEEGIEGFQLKSNSAGNVQDAISSGTVTLENQKLSSYTLPSTGGMGTGIFYGTGLSLMLFAFLGFVLNARKRRRGEGI